MNKPIQQLIAPYIAQDLAKKMVFLGGPRQVGKTTLSLNLLDQFKSGMYFNWDSTQDKKAMLNGSWSDDDKLIIFDEIHKYPKWKNLVKGYFDTQKTKHHFIVTGSARLDIYKRGGDSLLGRYHYWRLHPFSLFEHIDKLSSEEKLSRLMKMGGFPEVFLENDAREAKRWREDRKQRILKEDIRDLEHIRNIQLMELLLDLLKSKVGSTLSYKGLADDIQVSPTTVQKWIEIFEKMYLVFVVRGYDRLTTRAVHKPIKVYFFDNGEVEGDEAVIFENLVANHLLKKIHFLQDYGGDRYDLHYVKDKNQKEVDFLITLNKKPVELIEVKLSDEKPASNLLLFADKLQVKKASQIVLKNQKSFKKANLQIINPIGYFTDITSAF